MHCGSCGTELIPGKAFCHACGTPARAACPHCGSPIAAGFRFCPDCGGELRAEPAAAPAESPPSRAAAQQLERFTSHIPADLARKIRGTGASISGERKQVTVLFCDLTGSTQIAEELDPEEYRDLLDHYLELVFADVYRFEGIVNQLAGDGLMALFGAPIAHEDAPERAVRAALAVQSALARHAEQQRRDGRVELRARIGIHTGPVVVGTVGNDLKMDYTAIGDTTNLASRLQSLAEPGSVLVSGATERLVRGLFEVREAGPFEVRGKSEPVVAFEVLKAREAASPMALAEARGMTPWVGREAELGQLRDCFARVAGQLPQMVSVVGDAGSGKSRLLYEFKRWLDEQGAIVFETRCAPLLQSVPYAPWDNMLRGFFGLRRKDRGAEACDAIRERLLALDPELARIHAPLCQLLDLTKEDTPRADGDERRAEVFRAVSSLVMAASEKAPVVMIVEDLHWIDEPSREMLERAAAELDRARLMLVVSHRPDYRPNWNVRAAFTQLHLRPLPDDEALAIVRARARGVLPAELERRILRKAEGNPFFAEELVRALAEQGAFVRDNGDVRLSRPVDEIRIPDTVQELIGARLDRLPAEAKRVAQVASVFGRQFTREQVMALFDGERINVDRELLALERGGVIHRKDLSSPDEFRFGESLTLEVAYESLLLRERRQLHARIAESLEKDGRESGEPNYALLAHHHARSENLEPAVHALLAAAERAAALPSYPQAVELYTDAWQLAETALERAAEDAKPRLQQAAVRATRGLCQMLVMAGSPDAADPEAPALRGRELARAVGDDDSYAALLGYHGMLVLVRDAKRFDEGVAMVEEARDLARERGFELRALSIDRGLAWIYALDGRFELAIGRLREILAGLEKLGERDRLSDTYMGARYFYDRARLLADQFDGLEEDAQESIELAQRASNRTVLAGSSSTLAQLYLLRGEYEKALRTAELSIATGERIGNVAALRAGSAVTLAASLALGGPDLSKRFLESMDRSAEGAGDFLISSLVIVEALLAAGDLARAQRTAELSLRHSRGRLHLLLASVALGTVLVRRGSDHWGVAKRKLVAALGESRELGSRSCELAALLGLAELAAAAGETGVARELASRSLALVDETGLEYYRTRASALANAAQEGATASA